MSPIYIGSNVFDIPKIHTKDTWYSSKSSDDSVVPRVEAVKPEQPSPFELFCLGRHRTFWLFERGQVQESEANRLVDCLLGSTWSDDGVGTGPANGRGIRE